MKRVIIESPYAGDVQRNIDYAKMAMRDSLMRGEAPLASHLLYTQSGILNDLIPEERNLGIDAGHVWLLEAELVVVYEDLGISAGMRWGIGRAKSAEIPVEYRKIL